MDNWAAEDFIDTITPEVVEDDPWADPMEGYQLSTSSDKEDQLIYKTTSVPPLGDLELIDSEDPDDQMISVGESWNDWEDETLLSGYISDPEDIEWDEPEPEVEYDPDLREALHGEEYDDKDLARRLKINELVSRIEDVTEVQKGRIIDLLEKLSAGRLRSWLRWLHEQQWTGHSMILFLEFREVWSSKPEWWEYSRWDRQLECWYPHQSRNSLTMSDTYSLIQRRLHCRAHKVIEERWFEDYDYFTLWIRGFHSFASFALYRAGLKPDEDWKSDIGVYEDEFYKEGHIPYRHHTYYYPNGKGVVIWNGRGPISS